MFDFRMPMKNRALFLAYCFWATLVVHASCVAASFDCARASTNVERLICSSSELSKLDDLLADAYRGARAQASNAANLGREQRQWMARRDACVDADCIKKAYEARLGVLQSAGRNPAMKADSTAPTQCRVEDMRQLTSSQ